MDYDKVVEQICSYDGHRNQTRDIETTIRFQKPHAFIYECLFNITILSLDYLSKTKSKRIQKKLL